MTATAAPAIKPADVKRRLDLLAGAGLPVHISEFDYDISDDLRHKTAFAAMFPVFWEHPSVRGVTVWGHREGSIWRKNGYLIRKDGTDRPAMTWLREYLAAQGRSPLVSIRPFSPCFFTGRLFFFCLSQSKDTARATFKKKRKIPIV